MRRFVVLLRGVNVGSGNRVPMADFKALLEGLGYSEVKTLLNSGNAVFASADKAASKHTVEIAAALQDRLGVHASVIVKSASELESVVDANPIVPVKFEHSRFLVAFGASESALGSLDRLTTLVQAPEKFAITKDAAYLYCPSGILESKAGKAMLGKAGKGVTTRNWATVLKLAAMVRATAA